MRTLLRLGLAACLTGLMAPAAQAAEPQPPAGRGGRGFADPARRADMEDFHFLLANRARIEREVTNLPNGIETVTRSDDPEVATRLKQHVTAMTARMDAGRPIHARDPFFAELFRHAHKVRTQLIGLPDGMRVIETSDDAYTVTLLQEHARIVGLFIENGMAEVHRDHAVPKR